jgi:hypothetical protein
VGAGATRPTRLSAPPRTPPPSGIRCIKIFEQQRPPSTHHSCAFVVHQAGLCAVACALPCHAPYGPLYERLPWVDAAQHSGAACTPPSRLSPACGWAIVDGRVGVLAGRLPAGCREGKPFCGMAGLPSAFKDEHTPSRRTESAAHALPSKFTHSPHARSCIASTVTFHMPRARGKQQTAIHRAVGRWWPGGGHGWAGDHDPPHHQPIAGPVEHISARDGATAKGASQPVRPLVLQCITADL